MKLYNKNGQLSYYGFRCGYIESTKNFVSKVELYCENNTYFVQLHGMYCYSPDIEFNFAHERLNEARTVFNKVSTMVKNSNYTKLINL